MDLIQLKMPPDQVELLTDALSDWIEEHPLNPETPQLRKTEVWLTYRLNKWRASHPAVNPD